MAGGPKSSGHLTLAAGDPDEVQRYAMDFERLQPDVIVAHTALVVGTLH